MTDKITDRDRAAYLHKIMPSYLVPVGNSQISARPEQIRDSLADSKKQLQLYRTDEHNSNVYERNQEVKKSYVAHILPSESRLEFVDGIGWGARTIYSRISPNILNDLLNDADNFILSRFATIKSNISFEIHGKTDEKLTDEQQFEEILDHILELNELVANGMGGGSIHKFGSNFIVFSRLKNHIYIAISKTLLEIAPHMANFRTLGLFR